MHPTNAPRITVVTGARGALGQAVVAHLTAQSHRVVTVDRATAQAPGVDGYALAPQDPQAWPETVARIAQEVGPPTGAVLLAGAWQGGGPLHTRTDDAIWRAMQEANLDSAYRALRALLPGMVQRRTGSVAVVGARAAVRPEQGGGMAEYTASKAALVSLAQTVAAEVLGHGVRVNAVLPSTLDTPANRRAMPQADVAKWVTTGSLAGVLGFLLSDAARDISGAVIPVYGGA